MQTENEQGDIAEDAAGAIERVGDVRRHTVCGEHYGRRRQQAQAADPAVLHVLRFLYFFRQ